MINALKIDRLAKLEWVGTAGSLLESHDYLFVTKKGEDPFIEIQKSMHELNDFCVALMESVKSAGIEEKASYDELLNSAFEEGSYAEEDGFHKHFSLSVLAYSCEGFGRIFAPASAVLLLYGTLIRSLHAIAFHYDEKKFNNFQLAKERSGAELPPIRDLLESICGEKVDAFDHPQFNSLITSQARFLRNKFIHGDWVAVESALRSVNIRNCFAAVTFIFNELELMFDEQKTPSGRSFDVGFDNEGKWSLSVAKQL